MTRIKEPAFPGDMAIDVGPAAGFPSSEEYDACLAAHTISEARGLPPDCPADGPPWVCRVRGYFWAFGDDALRCAVSLSWPLATTRAVGPAVRIPTDEFLRLWEATGGVVIVSPLVPSVLAPAVPPTSPSSPDSVPTRIGSGRWPDSTAG